MHNDQYLDTYDTRLWYRTNQPLPQCFQEKFVPLERPDDITVTWLEKAKHLSANIWLQLWHTIARVFLGFFMTQTDVNGMLKRSSMYILSEEQFQKLLKASGFNIEYFMEKYSYISLLDIGAGDGEITCRLADSISQMNENVNLKVYATETSWTMRERLQQKQFVVVDKIHDVGSIPLIACLNVLDRCIDPYQIIEDIYNALAPNGRAIVALVLPYYHYVEFNSSHMPLRPLLPHWPDKARQFTFEAEATIFFEILEQIGFKVEAWTKAPYLCEGDLRQSFYWLVDVVVVLSKKSSVLR